MAQLTIRAPEEVVERVRSAAGESARSMNDFVVAVLEAATNPDYAGSEADEIRARLRLAGILYLDPPEETAPAGPDPELLAEAREAARSGTPLSDLIISDR